MNDEELIRIASANIRAKAARLGLMEHVLDIRLEDVDRIYFVGSIALRHVMTGSGNWQWDFPSEAHARIYQVFRPEIEAQMVSLDRDKVPSLRGMREIARPSLQVTWVEFEELIYGDMDIDLSSPIMDVVGFFIHLVEVLVPGPTDHVKLRKKLRKQGYDV